ncbi:LPS export ABC transporter periplasmic protein LptC [Candidatus Mcinerneyibacteriota bacterium]|nr:LPS export ABC transporter periplasmic protein LptC [Candidatus Mcinerneyibacteriota bacterium]
MRQYFFCIVLIVFILASCSRQEKPSEDTGSAEPGQVFEKGMSLTYTDRGTRVWEILADTLVQHEDETGEVRGENVKISFFSPEGDVEHIVTSDRGTIYLKTNDVTLQGNVILKNISQGTTVYTERVQYKAGDDKIISRDPVRVVRGTSTLEGQGMTVDLATSEIVISQPHGKE